MARRQVFPKFDGKPVTRTYSRLLWDCRRAGWTGTLTSGKRSYARQMYLWVQWKRGKPGFAPANPPWKSRHCKRGWRCAIDVTNGVLLEAVAQRRGWPVVRPYPREPWHLELYRRPKNTHLKGVRH